MRRKIFTIFIVPIILIMGGTIAYSGWSGSSVASFSQSAAVVSYTETLFFLGTNANLTPINIGNGYSNHTVVFNSPQFEISNSSGNAGGSANVYANVSNMVPGDWVEFSVTITNTGSVSLFAGAPNFSFASTSDTLSLGLLAPGQSLDYTVYLDLPSDSPSTYSGTSQLVNVSVPLTVIQ